MSFIAVFSIIAFVLAWNLAASTEAIPYLPHPLQIVRAFADDSLALGQGGVETARRAVLGLTIGSILGVAVALVLAWSQVAAGLFEPYTALFKSVPVLALIPMFILWFGLSEAARVAFVATASFFTVLVAAAEAIPNVPQILRWAAATLGASRRNIYRRVVLPSILPHIFGGFRNATTTAFALAVAAEFIGAQRGLGFYVMHAGINYRLDQMIAGVVAITVLAVVSDQFLLLVEARLLPWTERP